MKHRRRQSGSALLATLSLVFTGSLLVAATLAVSRIHTFGVAAHTELQRSMLVAEGAANRIQWLLAADRTANPETIVLGETDYNEYDYDRMIADGVIHTLDYHGEKLEFTITDAMSGYDLSAEAYDKTLNQLQQGLEDDPETVELIDYLRVELADYIDEDDDPADNGGMESNDYTELGMEPLPRNSEMEFREELLYLQHFSKLFEADADGRLSGIRLIAPHGFDPLTGTPSLITADKRMLMCYCDLEDEEADLVLDSLKLWRENREILSETLDEQLLSRLAPLSRRESGIYTVKITAPRSAPRPFRKLEFTIPGFYADGPDEQMLHYYQWSFF